MNNIKLNRIPMIGEWDEKYQCYRMTSDQMKRSDISYDKLYLVLYNGIWLLGRFVMQHYGWSFSPNLGAMNIQIDHLVYVWETEGLPQKKQGSIVEMIANYLPEKDEDE